MENQFHAKFIILISLYETIADENTCILKKISVGKIYEKVSK